MKSLFLEYWPSILMVLTVFVLSVIPVPEVPQAADVPLFDKWVHMLMYAAVAAAIWFDNYRTADKPTVSLSIILWAVLFPIVLGGLLELWQNYLTTCRSGEWMDFVADAIGTFLALPLGLWFIRPKARKMVDYVKSKFGQTTN